MVITYDIDPAARLVWLRYQGLAPDEKEWESMVTAVLDDPGLEPGFNFLADGRLVPVTNSTPFFQHIIAFLALHATKIGDCRIAILVSDDAMFGMGQHADALMNGNGGTIKAFSSLEEARTWLGGPVAVA